MKALVFNEKSGLRYVTDYPDPVPADGEAVVRILRAGICSTDLEILPGYVEGFDGVPGHEFVGVVERCDVEPALVGKRVVGEINCGCRPGFSDPDPVFMRNHAPGRTVLGIIGRDGAMAERLVIPAANLHVVPDSVSDQSACFVEPLAAACRILEQQVVKPGQQVAVVGDGKLGLLIAQVISDRAQAHLVHFGRHQDKLALPRGDHVREVVSEATADAFSQAFDVVVECSGSSQGIRLAAAICRPLGTLVLKTTCSLVGDQHMPQWSALSNDIVVNEKKLIGSRCGPFDMALDVLTSDPKVSELLQAMVSAVYPLSEGLAAFEKAQAKGCLKVVLEVGQE